jgi:hypothetical protein
MTWNLVDMLEDKRPRHISNLTDNLLIHQVAQADKACSRTCGDGDIIENRPDA